MKKTGLASLAENNKRECTISHQESALFTFKTMEDNKKKSFFKRTVALYLKAEKGKKKKKYGHATQRNGATGKRLQRWK